MKKVGGVFAFKLKDGPGGKEATWIVDVKNGKGSVTNDPGVYPNCCVSNICNVSKSKVFLFYFFHQALFSCFLPHG